MITIIKMTALAGCLLLALSWAVSTPMKAWSASGDSEVLTAMSGAGIEEILRALELEAEEIADNTYVFLLSDYKVILFNNKENLQLFAGFSDVASLSVINEWNRQIRFSRAYQDQDGSTVIEADLDLEGGVTRSNIEEFIITFQRSVSAFAGVLSRAAEYESTTESSPSASLGDGRKLGL